MQPWALLLPPTTPRLATPPPGLPEADVADVEVRRADDLADDDARARERRAGARGRLPRRVARRRPARAVRARHLGGCVEVDEVVVGDQDHPDRGLVLVDLVHAIDQRDLGGRHVGRAAEEGGVGRVAEKREPVGPPRDDRALGHVGCGEIEAEELVSLRRAVVAFALHEGPVRILEVASVVAHVHARVEVVVRVDVPRALRRADRRVEAQRRQVGPDGRRRVVDAPSGVGLDLRMLRGEPGLHHRGLLDGEALEAALRCGQREDQRRRRSAREGFRRGAERRVRRRIRERGLETVDIERERPEAVRLDDRLRPALRLGQRTGDGIPEVACRLVGRVSRRACGRHRDRHGNEDSQRGDRPCQASPAHGAPSMVNRSVHRSIPSRSHAD